MHEKCMKYVNKKKKRGKKDILALEYKILWEKIEEYDKKKVCGGPVEERESKKLFEKLNKVKNTWEKKLLKKS